MRGRADLLDPARMRLPVRVRALKPGQERMVDVDAPTRELLAQLGGEDLHVAGEHDELDVVGVDELEHPLLERNLVLGAADRPVLEIDAIEVRQEPRVRMIREHDRHIDRHIALAALEQQIAEAMLLLRREDQRLALPARDVNGQHGVIPDDDGVERLPQRVRARVGLHLQSHVEVAIIGVDELLALGDVAVDGEHRARDRVDDAGPIRTHEGHDKFRLAGSAHGH